MEDLTSPYSVALDGGAVYPALASRLEMHRSILAVVVLLCSCGGSQVSPELRRAASQVELLEGEVPPELEIVGQIDALSCGRQLGSDPDMSAAREGLKLEAARIGATAVANIFCEEEGTSFLDNCWKSIRCTGDALR